MELIYYLIFLDRDKMDVYWDKVTASLKKNNGHCCETALGTPL